MTTDKKILIYCEHIFHKPEKECEITIGIVNCLEIKRKNPNGWQGNKMGSVRMYAGWNAIVDSFFVVEFAYQFAAAVNWFLLTKWKWNGY